MINPNRDGGPTRLEVNFADGRIKGYDLTMPDGSHKTFFVQCVRGNPSCGSTIVVANGDGTITDRATDLMWAQADSGAAGFEATSTQSLTVTGAGDLFADDLESGTTSAWSSTTGGV